MRYPTILCYFLLLFFACTKETPIGITNFDFETITMIPAEIEEGSGLEITDNTYWSFNDNSGKERLYQFDKNGRLVHTLKLDVKKEDWEDITQDESGNFYLGDFGNNDNNRRDLKIYKILQSELQSLAKIKPAIIAFSFEDQSQFPPPDTQQHFDIEAMFALQNKLYLFTKDRSKPFSGKTRLYQLNNEIGTQTATFICEFQTDSKKAKGAITAGDISPDKSKIALLSNEVVWVFHGFTDTDFFNGSNDRFELPIKKQMEGIVFSDDCHLILINERKFNQPGELFRMNICK